MAWKPRTGLNWPSKRDRTATGARLRLETSLERGEARKIKKKEKKKEAILDES